MRLLVVLCVSIRALALISNAADRADTAWSQLEGLNAKANEPVPVGTNAVEFYAGREKALHDAAEEFVKQFPADTHRPQAMFWKIETTDFPEPVEQRISLLRQNELDARLIVENTALPQDLRISDPAHHSHSMVGQSGSDHDAWASRRDRGTNR